MKEQSKTQQVYEEFHKDAEALTDIISPQDFTYNNVLRIINRHLWSEAEILDIGCGTGVVSLYLASQGNIVTGIDISKKAAEAARLSAEAVGLENVSFSAMSFPEHCLLNGKFDFIVCSEVLEHIADDKAAIGKVFSLLSPTGILVLSVPSRNAPIHRLRMLFRKRDSFDENVGHLRRYSVHQITDLVRSSNLSVIDVRRAEGFIRNFFFVTSIGNRLLPFMKWPVMLIIDVLDYLTLLLLGESQIFVVARKETNG